METNTDNKNEMDEILQLVSFKIGTEEFGVNILQVQEINRMLQITKVPNTPDFIEGVINLRGRVIPVIDLRVKFNMPKKEHDKQTRIIVVELEDKTVGFLVDEVNEVLRIPKSITEAPPELVSNVNSEYITAVGKLEDRLIILLDLEKALTLQERAELENV
ncbi:MAG: chemotaxis protein CheW [Ignavibacteriales bacterium]